MISTLTTLTKVQESGVGWEAQIRPVLRTVASEEEAEEVAGTSDYEHWSEPLAWMDDAAATFIPDLCRRSRRDTDQIRTSKLS